MWGLLLCLSHYDHLQMQIPEDRELTPEEEERLMWEEQEKLDQLQQSIMADFDNMFSGKCKVVEGRMRVPEFLLLTLRWHL